MNRLQQILESGNEIFNHVPFPMMLTSKEGVVLWWSREAEKTFGYRAELVVGKFNPFIEEERSTMHKVTWDQVLRSVDPIRFENFLLHTKQGKEVNVSVVLKSLTIDNERCVIFLFEKDNSSITTDTIGLHELASIKNGLDQTFMLTYIDEEGLVFYANDLFLKTSKWTPKRVIGKSFWQLFPSGTGEMFANTIWTSLKSNQVWQGSVEKTTKDGENYWVEMTAIPVTSNTNEMMYYCILEKDITEKKRLQTHLEQIAYVDPETNLMNRHRLEYIVSNFIEEKRHFSFVFLDIDKFFTLKDMHDEDSETTLLLEFAKRMKMYFQDSDIARVGVDEFVVLTPLSEWFIQGFLSYLKQHPIYIRNTAIPISISGGITRYPEDQSTFLHLMKASNATIHKVKQDGGGNIVSLSKSTHQALSRKLTIEKRLIEALNQKDLQVYYQPQLDVRSGNIYAVEALVRWEDEVLGTVHPNELIPIAEESGMIHDIGTFMLEQACKQAASWLKEGRPLKVSINSSVREFRDHNMVKKIRQTLEKHNCPAHLLQIEITEKFALEAEAEQSIIRQMRLLQQDGVAFVLDDFGTGYASFRYMQLLPISEFKIDQSFISSIMQQEKLQKLIHGMIQFGKSMNIRVLAEGVETAEQFELLKELGCDALQGYYIGHPVTSEGLEQLIPTINV